MEAMSRLYGAQTHRVGRVSPTLALLPSFC
jgi:hypothetical protein